MVAVEKKKLLQICEIVTKYCTTNIVWHKKKVKKSGIAFKEYNELDLLYRLCVCVVMLKMSDDLWKFMSEHWTVY